MNHFSTPRLLKLLSIFIALSVCTQLSAKDYEKKIYLWDGVPKMETQKRDTILYYCPAKISGASPVMTEGDDSNDRNAELDRINHHGLSDSIAPTAAVIICPGGSYHHLGMSHEGFASARWFSSHGIAAFVFRYRVAYNFRHDPCQL